MSIYICPFYRFEHLLNGLRPSHPQKWRKQLGRGRLIMFRRDERNAALSGLFWHPEGPPEREDVPAQILRPLHRKLQPHRVRSTQIHFRLGKSSALSAVSRSAIRGSSAPTIDWSKSLAPWFMTSMLSTRRRKRIETRRCSGATTSTRSGKSTQKSWSYSKRER